MYKLYLVSGHSGSGKSTVMKKLMDNEIISFTTREMRKGETEGVDYIFITKQQFDEMKNNGKLAECTEYDGNFYGLTKEEIELKLSKGDAFCIVDFNGMQQLIKLYPEAVSIFLYTTKENAVRQMLNRSDKLINIEKRISTYEKEMENKKYYDYVIKNHYGKLEYTLEIFKNIIHMEANNH